MEDGRVLVTGATGFIGRALVPGLAAAGRPLTFATRRRSGSFATIAHEVPVGDIGRDTDWSGALERVDGVVHLAGHVHIAPERAKGDGSVFDEVNHRGAVRLFEEASARGVQVFVFVSSITVLGVATRPGRPFTDASAPDPHSAYARSKLAAEQALEAAAARTATRLVILRPPLVAGPGVGGNLHRLLRLAALPVPLPLGHIGNRRTLLSLDNLVSAIGTVLRADGPTGTFVLGDRGTLSTSDLLGHLREGLGRRPGLFGLPVSLLRRALALLDGEGAAQRLFGDLEVDASGFRRAAGWDDVAGTAATLRETAAAWTRRRPGVSP